MLRLLDGVFRSINECAESFWDAEKNRAIFQLTMSLQRLFHKSRVLRFDDREMFSNRSQNVTFVAV